MSEYFADCPEGEASGVFLPEAYAPRSIEGMLPDEIIYLDTECMVVDPQRQVYLRRYDEYNQASAKEPDLSNDVYIGIMRVFCVAGDRHQEVIDGYIIDMRGALMGNIEMFILDEEDKDELVPVLGIISEDADGNIRYNSLRRAETIAAAELLARDFDAKMSDAEATKLGYEDEVGMAGAEGSFETTEQHSPVVPKKRPED